MISTRRIATLFLMMTPVAVDAQTFESVRIDGPDSVAEEGTYLYTIVAEFDNGWEFEVTLDADLWLEPALFATIGPFGDLHTGDLTFDRVETLHASYTFADVTHSASLAITIKDAIGLVIDRVRPGGRFFLTPYCEYPQEVNNAVRSFQRDGDPVNVFFPGEIHRTGGTPAFDLDGNLLVNQNNQDQILVISPSGELVRTISEGGLDGPTAPAIAPDRTIIVGSYFTDSLKFYSPDGSYLGDFSHAGTEDPQCIAYDRQGYMYVGSRNNGNQRIAVFDQEHNFVRYIGDDILTADPRAIAFDRSENLWVAAELQQVYKFDRDGTLLDTIVHPELQPRGLALDENENVYVTDTEDFEVFVFTPDGELLDRIPIDFGPDPEPQLRLLGIAFQPLPPPPDYNDDGYVDLDDYDTFALCLELSGPDVTPPFDECLDVFDLNWDGDVDLQDFTEFLFFFSEG
jgi:DNA-binding beta-propeller fold protein YncE